MVANLPLTFWLNPIKLLFARPGAANITRRLSAQHFWATDGNRKLTYLTCLHTTTFISWSISSVVETISLAYATFTSSFCPWLKNVACLSYLLKRERGGHARERRHAKKLTQMCYHLRVLRWSVLSTTVVSWWLSMLWWVIPGRPRCHAMPRLCNTVIFSFHTP